MVPLLQLYVQNHSQLSKLKIRAHTFQSLYAAGHSVATIGKRLNLPVSVFVPVTTMPMMADKIRKQQAVVVVGGSNWNEADAECRKVLKEDSSARYIPPFDDPRIWAGHSTLIGT